ncbi:MOSC-domain-containing protein [Byssothecium circinans]|uniref:MOSC-domain-containing protein n=1 Tax=Byssothecium circinans TaxID=147558 RepID=A0A6A5UEC5_9PLEO|nr:MOSC-domain-containing protein [Byssothecium circinans]
MSTSQNQLYLTGAGVAVLLLYYLYNSVQASPKRKPMKISEIYIYPIKSLRATQPTSALATKHGFKHDRTFMLLQVTPEGHKNMAVSRYPEMTRFFPSIDLDAGTITITYKPTDPAKEPRSLKVPLQPDTEKLEPLNIDMHTSPTTGFKMQEKYNKWFSECFGYDVIFVYLGENKRDVLFKDMVSSSPIGSSWIPSLRPSVPAAQAITFADCAPYLVVSKTSLADVSSRLPAGEDMDVTKFRPNIVVEGAGEAWEEDYWRRVRIGHGGAEIVMLHNCVRCASVNIDYETGKPGTGESGKVLKKLQKDRRVDVGAKWSPVFGRYSFWTAKTPPQELRVGDEVRVVEVQKERSVFSWPGLS